MSNLQTIGQQAQASAQTLSLLSANEKTTYWQRWPML